MTSAHPVGSGIHLHLWLENSVNVPGRTTSVVRQCHCRTTNVEQFGPNSLPIQVFAQFTQQDLDLVSDKERTNHTDTRESASTKTPCTTNDNGVFTSAFGNKASGPRYHKVSEIRAGSLVQSGTAAAPDTNAT